MAADQKHDASRGQKVLQLRGRATADGGSACFFGSASPEEAAPVGSAQCSAPLAGCPGGGDIGPVFTFHIQIPSGAGHRQHLHAIPTCLTIPTSLQPACIKHLKKPPIAAPNSSNSSTQSVSSLPPGTASSIAGGPSAKPPSHALEGYLAPAPHAQSRNYQSTSSLQHHICNLATILGVQLGQPLEGAAVRRCRCRRRLHPQLLGFRLLLQEAPHAWDSCHSTLSLSLWPLPIVVSCCCAKAVPHAGRHAGRRR